MTEMNLPGHLILLMAPSGSGKTILLEAIHSFSPDVETELVVQSTTSIEEQREQWVPREKFSIFTGEISVTAFVEATDSDWNKLNDRIRNKCSIIADTDTLPKSFTCRLVHQYKNGDYVTSRMHINVPDMLVKDPKA
jgi:ABC-type Na+ transport system ATPase subunit NatA